MSKKKDVLDILADYSAQHGDPEDFEEARAAIASLIEAAQDYKTTQSSVWLEEQWVDLAARYCGDNDMPTTAQVVIAVRNRFYAALANVRGA